eukprot:scaffold605_cov400-Prasinococcus_capsulatus_cf.AAC.7
MGGPAHPQMHSIPTVPSLQCALRDCPHRLVKKMKMWAGDLAAGQAYCVKTPLASTVGMQLDGARTICGSAAQAVDNESKAHTHSIVTDRTD